MEFSKKSLIIIGVVVLVIIAAIVALVLFGGRGAEVVEPSGEVGAEVVAEPTAVVRSVEFAFSPASVEMAEHTEYMGKLYVQFIGNTSYYPVSFDYGEGDVWKLDNPFDVVVASVVAEECNATVPLAANSVAVKEYDISIVSYNAGTQTVTVSCGEFSADLTITVNEGANSYSSGGNGGGSNGSGGSTGGSTSGGYTGGDEGGGSTWVYDDSGITYGPDVYDGITDPTASM